ncbi:XK-related protein 5 isoform X3 [Balearica regulorum gibbericeps]|uniref:XK-related protein 5 isoform X3 n=1 Tax=Balearica regulorum gibbericeps TaxID=100784 RepID=UPI003F5E9423
MRGAFPGLCLALLAAERGARLCAIVHYLVSGQLGWFGLTIACVVPGYVAQLLSILWFRVDGRPPGCWLLMLHLLQLGLWKRYWDVFRTMAKAGCSACAGEVLMQHGDVCVLRLLEALLQTLPHLLLQAYVVVAVDPAGFVPGVSAGLSLLSLAWALVSYSHFACLLKPGHLCPPAAAILCLLLWRTGMLGTRVLALVLFARLYSFWVFAVAGATALVVYYSLLHPKCTEIWQGFLETTCSAAATGDDEVDGDSSQAGQSLGISGDGEALAGEGTTADPKNGNSSRLPQFGGCLEDGWTNHHHWLLVKLALKTGDMSTINAAFGDGGVGEVYPGGWVMGKPAGVEPGANPSLPTREMGPRGAESGLTDEKLQAAGNGGGGKPSTGAVRTGREDGAGQEPDFHPAVSFPSSFSPDPAKGSSVYFSASAGGITSPGMVTTTATSMALVQRDGEGQPPPGCLGEGGGGGGWDLSIGMASISPILGACAHEHLWSSSSLGGTGGCGAVGPPKEDSEPVGLEGVLVGWHHLQDTHACDTKGTVMRSKLRPLCFTSTPKADPRCPQRGLGELGEGTDLSGLLE